MPGGPAGAGPEGAAALGVTSPAGSGAGSSVSSVDADEEDDDDAAPVARNAAEAAEQLSRLCAMVVVTDGSRCAAGPHQRAMGGGGTQGPCWGGGKGREQRAGRQAAIAGGSCASWLQLGASGRGRSFVPRLRPWPNPLPHPPSSPSLPARLPPTLRGSYVSALGATQVFPPRWSKAAPVDTCGAGDNYAAGLLYGLMTGMDLGHVSASALRRLERQGALLSAPPAFDLSDRKRGAHIVALEGGLSSRRQSHPGKGCWAPAAATSSSGTQLLTRWTPHSAQLLGRRPPSRPLPWPRTAPAHPPPPRLARSQRTPRRASSRATGLSWTPPTRARW
jgi:hypothetical protein